MNFYKKELNANGVFNQFKMETIPTTYSLDQLINNPKNLYEKVKKIVFEIIKKVFNKNGKSNEYDFVNQSSYFSKKAQNDNSISQYKINFSIETDIKIALAQFLSTKRKEYNQYMIELKNIETVGGLVGFVHGYVLGIIAFKKNNKKLE